MKETDGLDQAAEPRTKSMRFGALRDERDATATRAEIDRYLDVELEIAIEVGTTRTTLDQVLDLVPGTVLRLDKRAGDPVDLRVNGKLIARGEVVKVDDCYGIRITSIVEAKDRVPAPRG
ncbi:MAG: flagellar motor switch protein FliN [Planctomycetes bacterium]|nr:flagellar motor switch protein FliN [Planctomycetota bacterium]